MPRSTWETPEEDMREGETQPNKVIESTPYKKKSKVIVIGDSLLYGIETEI